ncbi:jg7924 [Pararge aegeria aegeria]|uniref:Jg7924 protein n=1 Tax=Pararge aegeria aegeria TaxID=348720 RepID=A0A8S4R4I0_9NEOP|nr:jg7924 [Pararge aegeria aegeria]
MISKPRKLVEQCLPSIAPGCGTASEPRNNCTDNRQFNSLSSPQNAHGEICLKNLKLEGKIAYELMRNVELCTVIGAGSVVGRNKQVSYFACPE